MLNPGLDCSRTRRHTLIGVCSRSLPSCLASKFFLGFPGCLSSSISHLFKFDPYIEDLLENHLRVNLNIIIYSLCSHQGHSRQGTCLRHLKSYKAALKAFCKAHTCALADTEKHATASEVISTAMEVEGWQCFWIIPNKTSAKKLHEVNPRDILSLIDL